MELCRVKHFRGRVQVSVSTKTSISLGDEDPMYPVANDKDFNHLTASTEETLQVTNIKPLSEVISSSSIVQGTVIGCPEDSKALIGAAKGRFKYFCPTCKAGKVDGIPLKHGSVHITSEGDNNATSIEIEATALNDGCNVLEACQSSADAEVTPLLLLVKKTTDQSGSLKYILERVSLP